MHTDMEFIQLPQGLCKVELMYLPSQMLRKHQKFGKWALDDQFLFDYFAEDEDEMLIDYDLTLSTN